MYVVVVDRILVFGAVTLSGTHGFIAEDCCFALHATARRLNETMHVSMIAEFRLKGCAMGQSPQQVIPDWPPAALSTRGLRIR